MPPKIFLVPLLKHKPFIICADGGANKARASGITPNVIIGDLDSITQETLKFFSSVPVVQINDQYSTDLEKALDYLVASGCSSATVIGAMGERPDHTLSNFSILLKYQSRIAMKFLDERCSVEVVRKNISFAAKIGQQVSLVPMGKCSGIVTRGLKYPLKKETLELGVREGSSNEAVKTAVSISIKKGALLLFKIHPEYTA
jgi:thiamine pyrophosphokinase